MGERRNDRSNGYRALLVGATGLVGSALLRQLLADKQCTQVTVLARRPLADAVSAELQGKLQVIIADFEQMEEALAGVEAEVVFCALGTTIKKARTQEAFRRVDYDYPVALGEWSVQQGIQKMIVVSAMGANASSRIFYSRVKGEMEHQLSAFGLPELHVLRPSLLLGNRAELRVGEKVATLLSPLLRVLTVGPFRRYRPIYDGQVAAAMRAAAVDDGLLSKQGKVRMYESDEIAAAAAVMGMR
ncbi:NAD(P)H-binding protein [Paenibacillus mendelii]|uniref:NAD(P)H-binding protein n=1 Tax=Paenibacillus mendelii TaxID=206163 RepID=A0ABV6J783_9BACL|nr:NAD(P)H-binding protein [Paenibacillus mendelii]MCQ6561692.1 NAD(P)H-binding protein [Paenibacillus mendelii]